MDQSEYYSTNQEFQKFLISHNLDYLIEKQPENTNTYKSKNKKLMNHINNLHQLIFNEISKNRIDNNEFLFKLRNEINKFQIEY